MNHQYYQFDCGCRVKQFGTDLKPGDSLPSLEIDYYNLPDCPFIWDMFCAGNTKGIFQLETNVGKGISKKLEPRNLEELSALIALMRPGCANSIVDGKSMTNHYIDRKKGEEPVTSIHDQLTDVLEDTYQVLTYQEQSIAIAVKIAGFTPTEADTLRKSIGTKDAQLMTKVEGMFIEGCKKVGLVNEEDAKNIFEMIKSSNRYAFNKAHSASYAELGIWAMWDKYHFPLHFYTSWLYYSSEKLDPKEEVFQLVNNAKQAGIEVYPPQLSTVFNGDPGQFSLSKKGVHFGINNVKGIGNNNSIKFLDSMKELQVKYNKKISDFSWNEFLILVSDFTTKTVMNNLIMVGFFGQFREDRQKLLYDYNTWSGVNDREKEWFKTQDLSTPLPELLKKYASVDKKNGGPSNKNRAAKILGLYDALIKPPFSLKDTITEIAINERELLGATLTCTKRDAIDIIGGNCTCKEFLEGKDGKICLAVEIKELSVNNIKRGPNIGKKMAIMTFEDQSGILENVMCFNEVYEENKSLLYPGNVILAQGYKSKKDGNFIINSVKNV